MFLKFLCTSFTKVFVKTSRGFWKSLWWVGLNSLMCFFVALTNGPIRFDGLLNSPRRLFRFALVHKHVRQGAWNAFSKVIPIYMRVCFRTLHPIHLSFKLSSKNLCHICHGTLIVSFSVCSCCTSPANRLPHLLQKPPYPSDGEQGEGFVSQSICIRIHTSA